MMTSCRELTLWWARSGTPIGTELITLDNLKVLSVTSDGDGNFSDLFSRLNLPNLEKVEVSTYTSDDDAASGLLSMIRNSPRPSLLQYLRIRKCNHGPFPLLTDLLRLTPSLQELDLSITLPGLDQLASFLLCQKVLPKLRKLKLLYLNVTAIDDQAGNCIHRIVSARCERPNVQDASIRREQYSAQGSEPPPSIVSFTLQSGNPQYLLPNLSLLNRMHCSPACVEIENEEDKVPEQLVAWEKTLARIFTNCVSMQHRVEDLDDALASEYEIESVEHLYHTRIHIALNHFTKRAPSEIYDSPKYNFQQRARKILHKWKRLFFMDIPLTNRHWAIKRQTSLIYIPNDDVLGPFHGQLNLSITSHILENRMAMDYVAEPQHDEINLARLLRRLEKSAATSEQWKPTTTQPREEVWLRAQKTLQNLKFARKLVKNIEADDFEPSPKRVQRLNDIKIKLDHVQEFLKDVEKNSKPLSHKPEPILPTLPVPKISSTPSHNLPLRNSETPPPPENLEVQTPSPRISSQGLSISVPDPDEISPTLISAALPSLLPSYPPETATSTSFSRNFGSIPAPRELGGVHASTALHEELSSQLEVMAQQLKRNAIHFSTSLEKDKAVVEDAQLKLEGNYDTMQKERVRLRDHSSKSRSTMWMVIGIVILVVLVFMLMVSVIRFS